MCAKKSDPTPAGTAGENVQVVDVAQLLLGEKGTEADLQRLRHQLGLDQHAGDEAVEHHRVERLERLGDRGEQLDWFSSGEIWIEAIIAASQIDPSCSSPSLMTTKTVPGVECSRLPRAKMNCSSWE